MLMIAAIGKRQDAEYTHMRLEILVFMIFSIKKSRAFDDAIMNYK